MADVHPLTQRQIRCLGELPEDHEIVSIDEGPPIVRGPRGQLLRVKANGRMVELVETVKSYLQIHG
jgi:hypothetical protein